MLLVGITGRSGSGKSMVAKHYAQKGYASVDGDQVSRDVCGPGSPCVAELVEAFGPDILDNSGVLQRRLLAGIAFATPKGTQRLADITHPYILDETARLLDKAEKAGSPLFFFEGAAIVGQPFQDSLDKLVAVVTSPGLSLARIIERDCITEQAARQRLDAQTGEARLIEAADYVIENNGTIESLLEQADAVLRDLLREMDPRSTV